MMAAVCVPVRDEADRLPRLLDALAGQRGFGGFVLCVLLDGCSDRSAAILAERANTLPYPVVTGVSRGGPPNAGLARGRAVEIGLSVVPDDAMIVTTDADSTPDADWLAANVAALAVADVAAGRVVRSGGRANAAQDGIEAYYDALFALRRAIDPVPWEAARTHHCTSGASLAFRAGAYRAAGGFQPVPFAEDALLIDAAHRAGLRVRRDAAIRVATSARRHGRVRGGLAEHLRSLDEGRAAVTVTHPEDAAWRYERHAVARAAWPDVATHRLSLASALACDVAHVDRVAAEVGNAEAFATRVVPDVPGGERSVAFDVAERALVRLWHDRRALAA